MPARRLGLHKSGQVLLRVPLDGLAPDDLDGLLDGHYLLRAQLLARLELVRLRRASGLQVGEVLLVFVARGHRLLHFCLRGSRVLQELGPGGHDHAQALLGVVDLGGEVLDEDVELVCAGPLLVLDAGALALELVEELLQHLDDAVGVELVAHGVRRLRRLALLQEGGEGPPGLLGDELPLLQGRDLRQGRLGQVVRLCFENCNSSLQCGDGLRVVLVQLVVRGLLHVAHLGGSRVVTRPGGDIPVQQVGLCLQAGGLGLEFLDVGLQNRDLLLGLRDVARGLGLRVVAELLEGGVAHLLRLLVLLALRQHPLHQLNHLLHRRRSLRACPRRQGHGGQHECHGHLHSLGEWLGGVGRAGNVSPLEPRS
mmetsp:Transcript_58878/g.167564  ORF Transcript_58878/g.167564 Transcript_58878/m.167564 type:complete len:368 (+) Transcript_58878:1115-2218(+)